MCIDKIGIRDRQAATCGAVNQCAPIARRHRTPLVPPVDRHKVKAWVGGDGIRVNLLARWPQGQYVDDLRHGTLIMTVLVIVKG